MFVKNRYSSVLCFFDPTSELAVKIYNEISSILPMIGAVSCRDIEVYNRYSIKRLSDDQLKLIITLGGDGMMLRALHYFMGQNVHIYGINLGSVGFLLNKYNIKDLLSRIEESTITRLHPLRMDVKTMEGQSFSALAINEVSILRQTHQSAKFSVTVNNTVRLDEMVGDGILVSTPAGSTAYNAAAHGPIIPLDANVLLLTPINPFRPRRLNSILLQRQSVVLLHILDLQKRPVSAVADSFEIRNVVTVEVAECSDIHMSLLFDRDHSLEERILKEQFSS